MRVFVMRSLMALALCGAGPSLASLTSTEPCAARQAEAKAKGSEAGKQAAPASGMNRFKTEWKEVRTKYPAVAAAYLESLEYVLDSNTMPRRASQRRQFDALAEHLRTLGFRFRCHWVCETPEDSGGPVDPPDICPTCRLPQNPEDLEGYLSCLEKRLDCMLP